MRCSFLCLSDFMLVLAIPTSHQILIKTVENIILTVEKIFENRYLEHRVGGCNLNLNWFIKVGVFFFLNVM